MTRITRHKAPLHSAATRPRPGDCLTSLSLHWVFSTQNSDLKNYSLSVSLWSSVYVHVPLCLCDLQSAGHEMKKNPRLATVCLLWSVTDSSIRNRHSNTGQCWRHTRYLICPLFPSRSFSVFPLFTFLQSVPTCGQSEQGERRESREEWGGESWWHVKTTGSKLSVITSFHRCCSQDGPENREQRMLGYAHILSECSGGLTASSTRALKA